MKASQLAQASSEAKARINARDDPRGLVHVLFFPSDCSWSEEEIQGLSTPLPAGSDLSGLTSRYYTLAELAAS